MIYNTLIMDLLDVFAFNHTFPNSPVKIDKKRSVNKQ